MPLAENDPNKVPAIPPPVARILRVFAFDPSLATQMANFDISEVLTRVNWEPDRKYADPKDNSKLIVAKGLMPGPVGDYLEVVDVDPASNKAYAPVDLNDPYLLAADGLAPSEGNPQFHQQMVYAVAMTTIQHFERALGRRVFWSRRRVKLSKAESEAKERDDDWFPTHRLRIYPHALREENAYYDPDKKALLFGYFPARPEIAADGMPGGIVFTCLSQDIIAHETTHAILDGMQRYYLDPSNMDVLAFHEGFSDLVALFQHFTYPEILKRQIATARGDLSTETLLGQLAVQFGKATGKRAALRDALGRFDRTLNKWVRGSPRPEAYVDEEEPHARGALLIGAIFDAFLGIYTHRTRDLLRIATGGTGVLPQGDLHPDLVNRLAIEASKTAEHLLLMCIRAIDYCPPVDVTFGDFMRALITADFDLVPDDDRNYRVALIEAFRAWGIYPHDVRTLSVESLRWKPTQNSESVSKFVDVLRHAILDDSNKAQWDEICNERVAPGPNGSEMRKLTRMEIEQRIDTFCGMLHERIKNGVAKLVRNKQITPENMPFGLNLCYGDSTDLIFEIHQIRPVRRQGPDGLMKQDLLIQIRSGATVIRMKRFKCRRTSASKKSGRLKADRRNETFGIGVVLR